MTDGSGTTDGAGGARPRRRAVLLSGLAGAGAGVVTGAGAVFAVLPGARPGELLGEAMLT